MSYALRWTDPSSRSGSRWRRVEIAVRIRAGVSKPSLGPRSHLDETEPGDTSDPGRVGVLSFYPARANLDPHRQPFHLDGPVLSVVREALNIRPSHAEGPGLSRHHSGKPCGQGRVAQGAQYVGRSASLHDHRLQPGIKRSGLEELDDRVRKGVSCRVIEVRFEDEE